MIYHIVDLKLWEYAKKYGIYKGDTLTSDGFIHCSPLEKIVDVANYNYKGVKGLVLLCIDETKVTEEIRWEDLYEEGRCYPHIYGPLNLDSVVSVYSFEPNENGYFQLPLLLKKMIIVK